MPEPFTETSPTKHAGPPRGSLLELSLLFLRLGSTAIGGPAVHIAMMEEEVVTRRGWLTRAEFLDFLGTTNLLPGPNSTEMAIHVGRLRAGWRGLLVAGISFILPAALMVGCLAWAYVRYGALPQMAGLLYGVKPVVIVVLAQGALRLGRSAVKSACLAVLGVLAMVAAAGAVAVPFSLTLLFLVLLKIGATLFGGGYVLVAFLRSDLVARLGWLTERQLLDAVAVGQVTPGPLFTTATFVGYVLGGVPGRRSPR